MARSRPRSRSGRAADPVRITSARAGARADRRARERRYLISMAVRIACFIGAVAVGPGWLRWVLVAGAVFLPYIAVVMANAASPGEESAELRGIASPHPELDHPHPPGG